MTLAHVEVVKNTNNVVEESRRGVTRVVELDQYKGILSAYEEPLAEMRDSL